MGQEGKVGPPKPKMLEPAEITSAVYDTLDRIQGTVRGTADIGQGLKNPAAMKKRVLDVPDGLLKPFLSSDYEKNMHAYNRSMIPQIEVRKEFGSADLQSEFDKITDDYHIKIAAATSDEDKAQLLKQQAKDMSDLVQLRDKVLNQSGPKGDASLQLVRASNLIRGFNYLRMLGGQTTSALPDIARAVTRYGLVNTAGRTARFLGSIEANGLMRADAKRMGQALDWVLHTRAKTLGEIAGEEGGDSMAERVMSNATANFTKWSGVATWDSSLRTLSSALEQDAIYRAISKGELSPIEQGKLAQHGIGTDDLDAIRKQWEKFGSNDAGLNRARTELWTDKEAAEKVEQAVFQSGNSMAFHIGKGDMPTMMNNSAARIILQFKSFSMSSVNRMLVPLGQGLAHGDVGAYNGAAMLLALGGLTYYMKELAAGNLHPDVSPDRLIPEMVNRGGLLGYLPDYTDPVAGMLHLPRFSQYQDHDPVETLMGPTVGTLAMLQKTASGMTTGNITSGDIHRLRQLMPWQNMFWLRTIVNGVEGKVDDALDVKGAQHGSFADEMQYTPKKPAQSKEHLFGQEEIPNEF